MLRSGFWSAFVVCLPVYAVVVSLGRDVNRGPVLSNKAPVGVIDMPADGASGSSFIVSGWAADDRGIREVRVSVDGQPVAMAAFDQERPDVTRVFPQYRHGNDRHGWKTVIEVTQPGERTIRIDAVDTDGAITLLGVRRVSVPSQSSGHVKR